MVGTFASAHLLENPVTGKVIKQCVCTELGAIAATFGENALMIDWVNAQPLAAVLTCLGDGHDGIWNIIHHFAPTAQRREVLDWFHLMENLALGRGFPQTAQSSGNVAVAGTSGSSYCLICRL